MWQLRGPRAPLLQERKGEREMEREREEEFTSPTMNWPQKSHSTIFVTSFSEAFICKHTPRYRGNKKQTAALDETDFERACRAEIQYCYGHFWKTSSSYHKVVSFFKNKDNFSFKRWLLSAGCHNSAHLGRLSFPLDHQSQEMTVGPCTVSYSIRVTLATHWIRVSFSISKVKMKTPVLSIWLESWVASQQSTEAPSVNAQPGQSSSFSVRHRGFCY